MKTDGRLARCALKGTLGGALFALLCGCRHNLRKLLAYLSAQEMGDTLNTPDYKAGMPAHHSLHVALTAELCDFVAQLVASGRYQSSSEVVRAALRLLERAEAEPVAMRQPAPDPCTRGADELAS